MDELMSEEIEASLAARTCVPCRGGVPPLDSEHQETLLRQLPSWNIVDGHHLLRDYRFDDFLSALKFTNDAARIAEEQGHHPEITLGWGHAEVKIWTHKIDGLTESDFILAAKIDRL